MDVMALYEYDKALLLLLNGSDSLFFDRLMLVLTSGLTWIPLYISMLYIVIKNSETVSLVMLVLGCAAVCMMLSEGVADFIAKPFFARIRPCNDPSIKHLVSIAYDERATGFSFFSAHAANTFAIALFFSLLVRSRLLTTTMLLWSVLNCFTRLYLGFHYPSDILVGMAWGAVVGTFTYYIYRAIYKRMAPEIHFVSKQYTSTGYDKKNIDVLMLVLSTTLIYAVGRAIITV